MDNLKFKISKSQMLYVMMSVVSGMYCQIIGGILVQYCQGSEKLAVYRYVPGSGTTGRILVFARYWDCWLYTGAGEIVRILAVYTDCCCCCRRRLVVSHLSICCARSRSQQEPQTRSRSGWGCRHSRDISPTKTGCPSLYNSVLTQIPLGDMPDCICIYFFVTTARF